MSNTKMLIDATHPEETRVVVQRNGRVEEFDFESAARKLLRGNIYLAKVTRVEPSLQAAFVDYGGNRHGFLAFNEIHPDYYQIPVADRLALIEEEAAAEAELEAAADRRAEALARRAEAKGKRRSGEARTDAGEPGDETADTGSEIDAQAGDEEDSHIIDVEEDEHIEEVGGEDDEADQPKTKAAATADADDVISEEVSARAHEASELVSESPGAEADLSEPPHRHHEAEDDEDSEEEGAVAKAQSEPSTDTDSDGEPASEQDARADADVVEAASADNDNAEDAAVAENGDNGGADFHEEAPVRQRRRPRNYKIQEVIKRRQVILVQVVKEERGNKGAALTTYLSLAGRYTVLMPNTARGGGISRKITNPQDRKRLKAIANELDVPEGMGLIIRTAGAARTKQEIKRDFEYLLRLWESVRELTLQSTAPSLVYEEGDLIKRSIRDLYNKDVEEVVVAGDEGYEEASAFMHMLMPSHAKHVVRYKGASPLFTSFGVERQLNAMFQPQVTLRSGGYIVINQTEALVAIDVNSGKSTREFSIEETALATNLEAADEIARQLKLRDLAGLIVIDFIDMEEKRNNRAVERRLKDALRFDRARIQLGRISHFGLMEMSRQRLRTGVLEGSTSQCPHCQGTGIIRSTESIALAVLRGLEDAITSGANTPLIATTTPTVALYILNSKRAYIAEMESRHRYSITVIGSERVQGANFTIERGAASAQPSRRPERAAVNMDWGFEGEGDEEAPAAYNAEIETVGGPDESNGRGARGESDDESGGRRRRRRRRGRGRGNRGDRNEDGDRLDSQTAASEGTDFNADDAEPASDTSAEGADEESSEAASGPQQGSAGEQGRTGRRRRRGRRGGRRSREASQDQSEGDSDDAELAGQEAGDTDPSVSETAQRGEPSVADEADDEANSKPSRTTERIWDLPIEAAHNETRDAIEVDHGKPHRSKTDELSATAEPSVADAAPIRARHEAGSTEPRLERVFVRPDDANSVVEDASPTTQRKGWWQRRFGSE